MRSDEILATSADQLGQILKGVRKDLGLTQEQLGRKVGLHQKEISKMENGMSRTSVDRLFRLLSALEFELVVRPRDSDLQGGW
ncbi:MAG: helix-turn-helix transcriptional regulator [Candidatus Eremiobacteraeota bacterium]|nr:helix-turn-helix transcriptional regulator [Candidatus Eremiobacteraeota bacterium]